MPKCWIVLCVLLVAVLDTGCSRTAASKKSRLPGAAPDPNALHAAFILAQDAIKQTGPRGLTQFLTWTTRDELHVCTAGNRLGAIFKLPPMSGEPGRIHDPLKSGAGVNLNGPGFYFDSTALKRLCQPAIQARNSPTLVQGERKIEQWWQNNGMPSSIDPFPVGTRIAAAGFQLLPCAGGDRTLPLNFRTGDQPVPRMIAISVAKTDLTGNPCANPPQPGAVSIDNFYWVQLRPEDQCSAGQPGDFVVLVSMHLIEKTGQGWLWSTYWWEPKSISFPLPAAMSGAGFNPSAWNNYAMDARYQSQSEVSIFNPNFTIEPGGSSCAACHSQASIPEPTDPPTVAGPLVPTQGVLSLDFVFTPAKLN